MTGGWLRAAWFLKERIPEPACRTPLSDIYRFTI